MNIDSAIRISTNTAVSACLFLAADVITRVEVGIKARIATVPAAYDVTDNAMKALFNSWKVMR